MPLGLGGYLDLGIADTMEDLLVNFIGAVVFSAIGFIYVKTRGRSRIAPQFITQVLDVPEEAEEDSAAKAGGGAAQEGGVEKIGRIIHPCSGHTILVSDMEREEENTHV